MLLKGSACDELRSVEFLECLKSITAVEQLFQLVRDSP